jgi:hypothetical protein
MSTDPREPRKTFSATNLGPDGMLRVAYYVPMLGKVQLSSVVYRLRWDAAEFDSSMPTRSRNVRSERMRRIVQGTQSGAGRHIVAGAQNTSPGSR